MGVDFGGARIGVAVMECEIGLPAAKTPVTASGTLAKDAQALSTLAKAEQVEAIVVGLPLVEGQDTKMSRVCRQLGERIAELGWLVEYVDESLTSAESEEAMRQGGLTGAQIRKRVDGEAACRILLRYLGGHGAKEA